MSIPDRPTTAPVYMPGDLVWLWKNDDALRCMVRTHPRPDIDCPGVWLYSVVDTNHNRHAAREMELLEVPGGRMPRCGGGTR